MTNFLCAVIAVLATNWTTVSRTVPVLSSEQMTQAVMRYAQLNQVGVRVTNYVALVVWKGKTNEVVLESVSAAGEPLTRVIYDNECESSLRYIYTPTLHWERP